MKIICVIAIVIIYIFYIVINYDTKTELIQSLEQTNIDKNSLIAFEVILTFKFGRYLNLN